MGAPKTRRPSTTSTGTASPSSLDVRENVAMASLRSRPCCLILSHGDCIIFATVEECDVLVRILVFIVLSIPPRGVANSTNLLRNQLTSSW
eukprot:scaffold37397_cov36-Cyclotella_meneghiniana.AAC.2